MSFGLTLWPKLADQLQLRGRSAETTYRDPSGTRIKAISLKELRALEPERAQKLLRAYHRALKTAYPGEGEVESPAKFQRYLQRRDIDWDITVLQVGDRVVGGFNTNLHQSRLLRPDGKPAKVGAFEQGYVDDKYQKSAKRIFEDQARHMLAKGAAGLACEVNDPDLMKKQGKKEQIEQDKQRPNARADNMEFMEQVLQFRPLRSATYYQPSFGDGDPAVTHLRMAWRPHVSWLPAHQLTKDQLVAIASGFWATFDNLQGKDVSRDPAYRAMVAGTPAQLTF